MDQESKRILAKLRRLEEYQSFSPFCRIFYDLICAWATSAEGDGPALLEIFGEFLDIELSRHRSIGELGKAGSVTLLDLVEIAQNLREKVEAIFRKMEQVEGKSAVSRVVVNLIRAECSYHLGATEEVVAALEKAISEGCHHPIVFLALGFNLYCRAVKSHTERTEATDKLVIVDPTEFARACAAAVAAFRRGIRGEGSPYDGKLYWWIGSVSEIMHDNAEAIQAYRRAMDLDPRSFGDEGQRRIAGLSPASKDAISESEKARLASLPRITEEDVRKGIEWLSGLTGIDDLLGRE